MTDCNLRWRPTLGTRFCRMHGGQDRNDGTNLCTEAEPPVSTKKVRP